MKGSIHDIGESGPDGVVGLNNMKRRYKKNSLQNECSKIAICNSLCQ